jgi:glycosyltransferase involved in cell wall biosynthesis
MKIGYICNEYPPSPHGGIGTFVHIMAHAMKARGHAVTVVGLGQHADIRYDDGVRVVTLSTAHTRRISWFVNRWRFRQWIAGETARGHLDIVETPEFGGMLPFPSYACPVVVRLHLSARVIAACSGNKTSWSLKTCESNTLRRNPNWIAVSQYVLHQTSATFGLTPGASVVIHNPASLPQREDGIHLLDLPHQFVLYAGTVSARKGAYTLAAAARRFLPHHPEVHLVYAGAIATDDGVPADRRIYQILGPELAPRVRFLGQVCRATVAACMRRARLFAFPSTLEAFGLVAAEAMLSGLPVVVSNNGPFPEFVENEQTGLMVPPERPEALSLAIENLLEHPDFASTLGGRAAKIMSGRFSLDRCVSATEAFYAQALRRSSKPITTRKHQWDFS